MFSQAGVAPFVTLIVVLVIAAVAGYGFWVKNRSRSKSED
ncbi:hypothetical protein QFZ64_003638 [Streptomyces sp. B3I8]|jgi:hypothetical protein|nr:hypothetical protein [Streptomyces sp. B3I8]